MTVRFPKRVCQCPVPPAPNVMRSIADYEMPVGTTGIKFVAALPCVLLDHGIPMFNEDLVIKTVWSAAARLADMGLIDGQTFQFMRMAVPFNPIECAAYLGEPGGAATILAWEADTTPVPRSAWMSLAVRVREVAQEGGCVFEGLVNPPDLRKRVIRIYPPGTYGVHLGS
jgi:hypothetical protein